MIWQQIDGSTEFQRASLSTVTKKDEAQGPSISCRQKLSYSSPCSCHVESSQHLYSLLQPSEQELLTLPILQKVFCYYERNTLIKVGFLLQKDTSPYLQAASENSPTSLLQQSASAASSVTKRFPSCRQGHRAATPHHSTSRCSSICFK